VQVVWPVTAYLGFFCAQSQSAFEFNMETGERAQFKDRRFAVSGCMIVLACILETPANWV